jgi:hypothetical protein
MVLNMVLLKMVLNMVLLKMVLNMVQPTLSR